MPTAAADSAQGASLSTFDRAEALRRLGSEHFDVLVVGGGITGVGVALDAASRGLRTALVERRDFANGTSSKSSKMVHGGIRYLEQRELGSSTSRCTSASACWRTLPHLVTPLPFLIPLFGRDGVVQKNVARGVLGGPVALRRHWRVAHRQASPAHRPRRSPGSSADAAHRPSRGRLLLLRRLGRRRA